MKSILVCVAALLGAAGVAAARSGPPAEHTLAGVEPPPVLVELFTSEGCSSCPPADRLLQQLDGMHTGNGARIIGISEHVTYWDYLGWKDRFSSSVATQRQNAYGDSFHLDSVFTPQMVVNGRAQLVGSDVAGVRAAIDRQSSAATAARVHIAEVVPGADGLTLNLTLGGLPKHDDVYIVVAQDMATTPVQRGENSGHTLTHVSIARSLSRVGVTDGGEALAVHLPAAELQSSEGQKRHVVVFVQTRGTGPVLAADSIAL